MTVDLDLVARRCTATSKQSGQRCRRRPIVGGSVCVMHGGGAPQVRAAADARLLALVPAALDALERLVTDPRPEMTAMRLRAAIEILNRTGIKAPEQVSVEVPAGLSASVEARIKVLEARRLSELVDTRC